MMLSVPVKIKKMHGQVHGNAANLSPPTKVLFSLALENRVGNQLVPNMFCHWRFVGYNRFCWSLQSG
jgi:hypothetical protein